MPNNLNIWTDTEELMAQRLPYINSKCPGAHASGHFSSAQNLSLVSLPSPFYLRSIASISAKGIDGSIETEQKARLQRGRRNEREDRITIV
ncbi:MAG: hypothetical protein K2H16_09220, partial [Prevotella sp.]|nr:hypothetical protein [Prevotella sp.]